MVIRMRNFNILEVHWKIQLWGRGFTKYRGGDFLGRGAWIVCWFDAWGGGGGGSARKREVVFLRKGPISQCTLSFTDLLLVAFFCHIEKTNERGLSESSQRVSKLLTSRLFGIRSFHVKKYHTNGRYISASASFV